MYLFGIKQSKNPRYYSDNPGSINLRRRPSTGISLSKSVVLRRSALSQVDEMPRPYSRQSGLKISKAQTKKFAEISGLKPSRGINAILLHSLCFSHHLHLLTLGPMPLKAHTMLQVRNHIALLADIPHDKPLEVRTEIKCHRYVAKGVEVEAGSSVFAEDQAVWANSCAYFFPIKHNQTTDLVPESAVFNPMLTARPSGEWSMRRNGWRFARLSGDYNGIHTSRRYARLMGFKDAFCHSQPVLANCLERLAKGQDGKAFRIDAALKGPVYYGQGVALFADDQGRFDLMAHGNDRPVVMGRFRLIDSAGDNSFGKEMSYAF